MASRHLAGVCAAAALALTIAACGGGGGGGGTPTSPSPSPTPSPSPAPSPSPSPGGASTDATITITSAGVSPKILTVSVGTRVNFVNNDSRAHDMASDPHPIHTDCPDINTVGFLQAGQSRLTGSLNVARTCGYHDHDDPDNARWQGSIAIR